MNAKQAHQITKDNSKAFCKIKNKIEKAAKSGLSKIFCIWDKDELSDQIIEWLTEEGFGIKYEYYYAYCRIPMLIYTISW